MRGIWEQYESNMRAIWAFLPVWHAEKKKAHFYNDSAPILIQGPSDFTMNSLFVMLFLSLHLALSFSLCLSHTHTSQKITDSNPPSHRIWSIRPQIRCLSLSRARARACSPSLSLPYTHISSNQILNSNPHTQGPSNAGTKSRVFAVSSPEESVQACRMLVSHITIPKSVCCAACRTGRTLIVMHSVCDLVVIHLYHQCSSEQIV